MEAVTVTLHGASNLPATREGRAPRPYVIVKPSGDEQQQEVRVTRASSEPTHSPTWEEEVTVEINAKDVGWEALTLTVADQGTKEALAIYRLPVRHLQPFHHYHCRLALQPRQKDPVGTSLYVTVVRKGSVIPRSEGMDYAALEVLLQGMTAPLAGPRGALVAVASIVTNVRAYEEGMAKRPAARPGVALTTVTFPEPSAADFSLGHAADRGCPQLSHRSSIWRRRPWRLLFPLSPKMTHPAGPPEKPTWNTSFLFQGRDGATIFSEDAALAIEYYPYKAMSDAESALGPLGYSVLPLTPGVYRRLVAGGSRSGLRVDSLPVQGTELKTTSGAAPAVGLCLQLVRSQRPDTFLSPASSAALPSLDATSLGMLQGTQELLRPLGPPGPRGQDEPPEVRAGRQQAAAGSASIRSSRRAARALERPRRVLMLQPPSSALHQGDASLPPADAVAGILPEKPPYPRETAAAPEEQRCQDGARDQQDQEATNYRLALERMADDILSLRQHVASLEVENSNLRRSLAMHEDPGRTLLSDIDVDVMTRAEILDRIATLKCKLASGTVEMRSLKDRVQQLQNELIRKNDQEKDLVMLQRAHQQQQAVLRRYEEKVAKMKGLEETVRQQEKVIETMERMLEERLSEAGRSTQKPAGEALARELYDALLAENRRLREELARPRHPSPPVAPPPQALPDVFSGSEKVSLLAKLEKEQARSRVLESQLEEASRRWGREKQELSTRLLEQDHGFRGWSSSFAHDLAMKMPLDPTAPVKRHQTLDPLP
ncbi:coiled-coil domain-containing protein 33 isoform X2 [Struthio camelus]|uniref:coiled-coil domain-containing protein 33 isoform X2 n=1 Tax=Struthio camelus TaxID=8801 RepID=UPI003603FFBA